jgi:hypothetical protein
VGFVRKIIGKDSKSEFRTAMSVNDAITIIQEYGEVMLHKSPAPFFIADIKKLPYPKDSIKNALMLVLSAKAHEGMMDALKIGYLQLANWQEEVGDTDMAIGMVDDGESSQDKLKRVKAHYEEVKIRNALLEDERAVLKNDLVSIGVW